MATSTLAPTDDAASPPVPRREVLLSFAAQVEALDALIDRAQRSIRVFDIDLSEMGWNTTARAERITRFVRASQTATLDIVVHDTQWIERSCPRLTNLLKFYAHAITIRRTGEDAKHATDPLAIVDDRHFLHRLHIARARAVLSTDNLEAAKPLVARLDAIWAGAVPGVSASVTGL